MLRAFVNAFKIPDLRRKLLFTLAMIAVYRIGAWIPVPGVNVDLLRQATGVGEAANIVGIVNVFAGGALQQMAVFALGIMPYITASIIMQLLAVVIPKLEALQREGEQGRKKITQYTRYVTVGARAAAGHGPGDPGAQRHRLRRERRPRRHRHGRR